MRTASLPFDRSGDGAPILLVHGTASDARVWDRALPHLARAGTVIRYDRRGYGAAPGPLPPAAGVYRAHAADAARVIEAAGAGPARVVGWSSGGFVALHLAIDRPDLVRSVVLAEAPLHARSFHSAGTAWAFTRMLAHAALGHEETAAAIFLRVVTAYANGGNGFDALDPALRAAMLAQARPALAEVRAGTGEDLDRASLARVAGVPVRYLAGSRSGPMIRWVLDRLRTLLPEAETRWIDGAGHLMMVERPEAFAAAVG